MQRPPGYGFVAPAIGARIAPVGGREVESALPVRVASVALAGDAHVGRMRRPERHAVLQQTQLASPLAAGRSVTRDPERETRDGRQRGMVDASRDRPYRLWKNGESPRWRERYEHGEHVRGEGQHQEEPGHSPADLPRERHHLNAAATEAVAAGNPAEGVALGPLNRPRLCR